MIHNKSFFKQNHENGILCVILIMNSLYYLVNKSLLVFNNMKYCMIIKKQIQNKSLINEKFIVLFGVPGVGKGTYGNLLEKDLKYYKLTPGDIIRKIIKDSSGNENEFTKNLKNTIK